MMRTVTLFLAAALLAGCFSPGNFYNLPATDQARFNRCVAPVFETNCPDPRPPAIGMCQNSMRSDYADLPSTNARMEWLTAQGCQASVIVNK